jgi:hypothetical protein
VLVDRGAAVADSLAAAFGGSTPIPSRERYAFLYRWLWTLARDANATAAGAGARLRAGAEPDSVPGPLKIEMRGLADLLDGWSAAREGRPDVARELLSAVRDRVADGSAPSGLYQTLGSRPVLMAAAMAWTELGEPAAAVDMLRRASFVANDFQPHEAERLAMIARGAAAAGDTAEAIEAARAYLGFRRHADPELQGEVDEIRALLAGLGG